MELAEKLGTSQPDQRQPDYPGVWLLSRRADRAGRSLTLNAGWKSPTRQDLQPLYGGNAVLGCIYYLQGKIAEGIHHIDVSLEMSTRFNLMLNRPLYMAWRAEADLLNGDAQAALTRAEEAVRLAETIHMSVGQAEAWRVVGRAAARLADWTKAAAAFGTGGPGVLAARPSRSARAKSASGPSGSLPV
jgi:hypothetical protein